MDWFFVIIIVILIFCLDVYCEHYNRVKKKLVKERTLIKADTCIRDRKREQKEKRNRWKNISKKGMLISIAFSPFYNLPELFYKCSFAFAVLCFKATDFFQPVLDRTDKWLVFLFYRKLENEITALDVNIEKRQQRINMLEQKLAAL